MSHIYYVLSYQISFYTLPRQLIATRVNRVILDTTDYRNVYLFLYVYNMINTFYFYFFIETRIKKIDRKRNYNKITTYIF